MLETAIERPRLRGLDKHRPSHGSLAGLGIFMAPLAWAAIGGLFAAALVFFIGLDIVKVPLFGRLKLT